MKASKTSLTMILGLGAALFGCQPEEVGPSKTGQGNRRLSASIGEDHPVMDTICAYSDSVFFRSVASTNMNTNAYPASTNPSMVYPEATPTAYSYPASFYVNKCLDPDPNGPASGPAGFMAGNVIPCTTPQMKWGSLVMYNGYLFETNDSVHYLDVDLSLATGYLCDYNHWIFATSNSIAVDPLTGVPNLAAVNWTAAMVDPARNQWKVAVPVGDLPSPCFDFACRMSVYRLKMNGSPNENFRTTMWAINENWNTSGHPAESSNEYSMHYCPFSCLEAPASPSCPPTQTVSVCKVVHTGLTCAGGTAMGTTTLTADSTGTHGEAIYLWSNGQTSRDITVTPTSNTAYSVTVTSRGCTNFYMTFNVTVIDAGCAIAVVGGGGCGGGNGNPTCGNVDQVTSNTGVSYTSNVLGSPNNSGASFTNTGHKITIKLDHTLPTGTEYKIYWKKSGSGTASLKVSESQNNSSYTVNAISPFTTTSTYYVTRTLTTAGPTRYLRLESMSSTDLYVDAITYCFTPPPTTTPGVKICHVPPGNPSGAATVCVSYAQIGLHLVGLCNGNGGSGTGNPVGGHGSDYLGTCNGNPCN